MEKTAPIRAIEKKDSSSLTNVERHFTKWFGTIWVTLRLIANIRRSHNGIREFEKNRQNATVSVFAFRCFNENCSNIYVIQSDRKNTWNNNKQNQIRPYKDFDPNMDPLGLDWGK